MSCKDADIELSVRAILFGAVGTAGQRCTTTRRLFLERSVYDSVIERLAKAYKQIPIGDPREESTLCGPLINKRAVESYFAAIEEATKAGAKIEVGGRLREGLKSGLYVEPCLLSAEAQLEVMQKETFAPILYAIPFDSLEEAVRMQNDVPQGLSSAIFTSSVKNSELFLSASGSDCGIANVNIGTSGAEIGGAFGGEKETGGGRESGSDSWRAYMRRQTNTINWGDDLPLAQGVSFG